MNFSFKCTAEVSRVLTLKYKYICKHYTYICVFSPYMNSYSPDFDLVIYGTINQKMVILSYGEINTNRVNIRWKRYQEYSV